MGTWCDDYLRQLATTAVRVNSISEIVAMQAELLKHREPSTKVQPVAIATLEAQSGTAKHKMHAKQSLSSSRQPTLKGRVL